MDLYDKYNDIFESGLLDQISLVGKKMSVPEGEVILNIGQTVRTIPLILSGSVKVIRQDEDGKELLLYYVNSHESCAMTFTCCMEQFPSEIMAVAENEVELIAIPITYMDEWMAKYPSWKSFAMRTIRARFNELLKAVDQLAFQKLDERLVHYLKEKSKSTGSSLINLSHEQMANELATSRVVISRLLKKLEEDKKLLLYRNQVKLLKEL